MSRDNDSTRLDLRVNTQDPSTWLEPGRTLIGADGRDWAWAYVIYEEVPGFPAYCVGTNGRVWSRWKRLYGPRAKGPRMGYGDTWRRIKPAAYRGGYLYILVSTLETVGQIHKSVHTLVLETFVGPAPEGMECRHLNRDRQDNRLRNLWWGTKKENQGDRFRHGTDVRGEGNGRARLTRSDVVQIRREYADGATNEQIQAKWKLSSAHAYRIVNRIAWKHV